MSDAVSIKPLGAARMQIAAGVLVELCEHYPVYTADMIRGAMSTVSRQLVVFTNDAGRIAIFDAGAPDLDAEKAEFMRQEKRSWQVEGNPGWELHAAGPLPGR